MKTTQIKKMSMVLVAIVCLSLLILFCDSSWGGEHTVLNPAYIPQIYWTRGCCPTAASMVLGYRDNYGGGYSNIGSGALIDYWRDLSRYVDGRPCPANDKEDPIFCMHNVPNLLDELRIAMKTDSDGETFYFNIGSGITSVTNQAGHGYSYASHECLGSLFNDFCWETMKTEIDADQPFVWAVSSGVF